MRCHLLQLSSDTYTESERDVSLAKNKRRVVKVSELDLGKKRSWVRRARENESYCRTCKTWKPKSEFYYRDIALGLLEYDCIECLKAHRRNSYANHRETARAANNEWTRGAVASANEYLYQYLLAHSCVDCGNNNILTLTFDHVRGKKKGNVSEMVARGRAIETIKVEIEKCEVVCFNCHMRRERKRRGGR